jgi:hypothetical protein
MNHDPPPTSARCTIGTTNVSELSYLHSRDVTDATLCHGPYEESARYRDFMGWEMPWYSAEDSLDARLVGRQIGKMHLICYLHQRRPDIRGLPDHRPWRGADDGPHLPAAGQDHLWTPGDLEGLARRVAPGMGKRRPGRRQGVASPFAALSRNLEPTGTPPAHRPAGTDSRPVPYEAPQRPRPAPRRGWAVALGWDRRKRTQYEIRRTWSQAVRQDEGRRVASALAARRKSAPWSSRRLQLVQLRRLVGYAGAPAFRAKQASRISYIVTPALST